MKGPVEFLTCHHPEACPHSRLPSADEPAPVEPSLRSVEVTWTPACAARARNSPTSQKPVKHGGSGTPSCAASLPTRCRTPPGARRALWAADRVLLPGRRARPASGAHHGALSAEPRECGTRFRRARRMQMQRSSAVGPASRAAGLRPSSCNGGPAPSPPPCFLGSGETAVKRP